jgi:hypothetical protein
MLAWGAVFALCQSPELLTQERLKDNAAIIAAKVSIPQISGLQARAREIGGSEICPTQHRTVKGCVTQLPATQAQTRSTIDVRFVFESVYHNKISSP